MDAVIYVGLALVLAVILFVAFGRKKEEPKAAPKPIAEGTKSREPSKTKADDKSKAGLDEKVRGDDKPRAETKAKPEKPTPAGEAEGPKKASEAELKADATTRPSKPEPATETEPAEPPMLIPARPSREPEPPSNREVPEAASTPEAQPGRVDLMRLGLAKSREGTGFFGKLKALFTRKAEIRPEIAAEIEEVLLSSDVGVATTAALLDDIRGRLGRGELASSEAVWDAVRRRTVEILTVDGKEGGLRFTARPTVVLLVGVNGAGKTTTIGKLATQLRSQGKKCVLAAADTFRAAAVQQLVVWGERVGCEVVRGKDGADPGSVIFEAIKKAEQVGADVVLADTAGRLHTKANLMSEMQKIARTVAKAMPGAPHETLLVIDATNGQNALAQATEFKQKLELTGIVLTKLDGTAKGGVVLGIANTLRVPVRFIGLGERPDDLHEFDPKDFVDALLGSDTSNA